MTQIPQTAAAALERGNKIEAIRLVREATNLGLKESKDLVDAYISEHPMLRDKLDAARIIVGPSMLIPAIILSAIIAAICWWAQHR